MGVLVLFVCIGISLMFHNAHVPIYLNHKCIQLILIIDMCLIQLYASFTNNMYMYTQELFMWFHSILYLRLLMC